MSATPSAMAMRAAEKICDLHVVTRRDITNIAAIIDNEFKELVDLRAALKDIADWPRPFTGLTANAMADHAKTILAAVAKGTHDKAE